MPNSIVAPEIWSKALLDKIAPINVALNFANQAYTDEVLAMGDTVHVVTPGSVTTGTYTKGTDITPGTVADVDEALAITDTLFWAFDVDHIERLQSNPQTVAKYMIEAGRKISRDVDSYLFAAHSQAHAGNKIAGASSAAIDVSSDTAGTAAYELLVDASVKLTSFDVPLDRRWVVVTPFVHGLLLKSKDYFVKASALGDTVVTTARFEGSTALGTPGFVGQIAGFDVYVSSNLPTASAGANAYLVYGQGQPISYVSQLNTVEAVPLARQFGVSLKQLILHGKKVFAEDSKRLGSIYIVNS